MTRVLIVEDHPIVVTGILAALRATPGLEVAGTADGVANARNLLASTQVDVMLLDLRLSDGNGMDLLRELAQAGTGPSTLVLSSFMTPEHVSAAVALGASGFLLKSVDSAEIVSAICKVASGGVAFTIDQLREARGASPAPLTMTEHSVLAGLLAGRSNDEIATDLEITRKTVEGHLTRLYARFEVLSRTELALVAERRSLLDLPTRPRHTRPGTT